MESVYINPAVSYFMKHDLRFGHNILCHEHGFLNHNSDVNYVSYTK